MKTLREYILEAMKQEEFLQKIHDIYNDDYDEVFKVLSKHDPNTLKEKQEKLRDLFKKRGLSLNNRNELIIKNICREFNIDTIKNFVELCEKEKENKGDIFNIEGKKSSILRNDEIFNFEKENLMELFNYLIDIEYFSKEKNKAASGKFELLFILLYGKIKDENDKDRNFSGDLPISETVKIEIKSIRSKNKNSKAPLASNVGKNKCKSIETLSEIFLQNIFTNKTDKENIIEIFRSDNQENFKSDKQENFKDKINSFIKNEKTNYNIEQRNTYKEGQTRCLGNESANINIMYILNTFLSNHNIKPSEELCKKIFESYINVLLSQFGQEDKTNDVFNELTNNKELTNNNYNPFFIENDDFIYCKKLTQITGAIHLYGYALNKGFNHILICDQSTSDCICITNVNEIDSIKNVLDNIIFLAAEVNKNDSERMNNVSKIKGFKK